LNDQITSCINLVAQYRADQLRRQCELGVGIHAALDFGWSHGRLIGGEPLFYLNSLCCVFIATEEFENNQKPAINIEPFANVAYRRNT
jgi:hypothetical protein